jgi:hypothetical protein
LSLDIFDVSTSYLIISITIPHFNLCTDFGIFVIFKKFFYLVDSGLAAAKGSCSQMSTDSFLAKKGPAFLNVFLSPHWLPLCGRACTPLCAVLNVEEAAGSRASTISVGTARGAVPALPFSPKTQ